jgi:acetyl esterase/lipase
MRRQALALALLVAAGQPAAQVPPDIAPKIRAIGPVLNPKMIEETFKLYVPRVAKSAPNASETPDLAYGPDERQRLDIFAPVPKPARGAPVVVFVPGGGYVGGAKSRPGLPFYQNVGVFFATNGMIGVTMNYRLAPKHPWPAGGEDVASALKWLRGNIAQYGGDPRRIFLFGQSAGATHVAHYIFDERLQPPGGEDGVAGAILQSPVLDPAAAPPGPNVEAYYGKDRAAWRERSLHGRLDGRRMPIFLAYAELDPPEFRKEAARLYEGLCKRDGGTCPRTRDLAGHNHISEIVHLGSDDKPFGRDLLDFVRGGVR